MHESMMLELIDDQLAKLRLEKYSAILKQATASGSVSHSSDHSTERLLYLDYLFLGLGKDEAAVFIDRKPALRIIELFNDGVVYETMVVSKNSEVSLDGGKLIIGAIGYLYDAEHLAWREQSVE